MKWLDNPRWGRGEQGAMILGLYEQEVLNNLSEAPDRYRVLVDVGAGDGYYAVGLLYSGKVDRSIAFEAIPECRAAIARLAAENGVADKITVLGAASDRFVDTLRAQNIDSRETMFLIDIEGAEFKVLTEEFFAFLKDSLIVVETHAHIYADLRGEMERVIQRASMTHRTTNWYPGARNPWTIKELESFAEIDRWILCSEGRFEVQQWLRFDPL
jgi:precorrin-6B methylase 2